MKKSTVKDILIISIPIVLLLFIFWVCGMFDMVYQVFGSLGIIGMFTFIALLLAFILFATKMAKKAVQPKTLANRLPATATVINSYQGNMKISFGGVNQNYQLIIEVDVTNPQGETWPAKMKEMINLTQVGLFQPGVSFKVLYDPNNRSKVVFDQSQQAAQQQAFNSSVNIPGYETVNSQMAQQAVQNQPQEIVLQLQAVKSLLESLKNTGISTTATVLSREVVHENFIPGVDAVNIRSRVAKSNYETEELLITPKTSLYKSEPGKTIYVLYDPINPKRVGISGLDKPESTIAL